MNRNTKTSSKIGRRIKQGLIASSAILAIGFGAVGAPSASASGCKTFSSGRVTCSSTSNGYTSYNSFNYNTGRISSGYRYSSGSSSYGSNTWSSPRSYGGFSYNSYGLGSGSRSTFRNSWSNSYGWGS